jgi:ActR/RegA family two-component response regulator
MEAQDDPGIALLVLNCDVANSEAILLALVDRCRFARIVGITNRPSFVHVATVIRSGASAVLARPATFGQIVAALDSNPPVGHVERRHMSLDRVIWEFISQAVLEAGSISEAARRLQLDRTSLKRMLRKVPPLK